ncbi:MAG: DUF2207 domain-containing protein [Microcella sp.]|uniref:DUF2207 domain-containing protein n=1 Tax=Microcella sp. TaxID=1913979 RepID=UPI0033163C35
MRAPGRLALTLVLAGGFALGLAPAVGGATAGARDVSDFTFDSFDADYSLSREADGTATLQVVETIVARFPDRDQNRGIIRAIPDDYDGVPLNTVVDSVTDERGDPVFFESFTAGGFVELALGTDEFVRGVQTYVISYTQQNVVRSFDDTNADEFYWDVNGTGWQQPFGRVSATVALTPDVASALTGNAACYVGAFGEDETCPIEAISGESAPDGVDTVVTASASDLAPGETLTVAIGFEPGTFLTPEPVRPTPPPPPPPLPWWMHLVSGGLGLASTGALVASIVSRVRAGGGATGRGVIIPQYTEPEGIDILQAAQLLGRSTSAIPAAVVRLAVRKNLRILAYPVEKGGAPYTLQYLSDDRTDVLDRAVLTALFGRARDVGELREYGTYDSALGARLTTLATGARASLLTDGFRRRPSGVGFGWLMVVAQMVVGFLAVITVAISAEFFDDASPFALLAIPGTVFAGIIAFALAVRPLQLTEKGRAARDHLEGMRLYLTVAEQDRLRMLQSPQGAERIDVGSDLELVKLYERLLPWAVVWGVEDQWMRELAIRVAATDTTPEWYVGRTGFDAAIFSTAVRGVTTTVTAPRSSSRGWSGSGGGNFSGGSFGGGFSGGGGGGGGGGGR